MRNISSRARSRTVRGAVITVVGLATGGLSVPTSHVAAAATQAAVTPLVACKATNGGTTTVWFGYRNDAVFRVTVPVGAANTIDIPTFTEGANLGQVEQFRQGTTTMAFGVQLPVASGAEASWRLTVPEIVSGNATGNSLNVSATSGPATPACAAGISTRSATVQMSGGVSPRLRITAVKERRNSSGLLTKSSVALSITGLVSKCSSGGTPIPPRVLWGYGGPSMNTNGTILSSAGASYQPVPGRTVVRTDSDAYYRFVRTTSAIRPVVDPQRAFAFGSLQQQITGAAPFARGLSSELVIADVTALCRFGNSVVASSVDYWFDADGYPITVMTTTDLTSQSTREAVSCLISNQPLTSTCDNVIIGLGPGGPRLRV